MYLICSSAYLMKMYTLYSQDFELERCQSFLSNSIHSFNRILYSNIGAFKYVTMFL